MGARRRGTKRRGAWRCDCVAVRDLRLRVGSGELGALPVVLGLALIWTYFELQDAHFLTARNLSNLVLQISVSGSIAVGVVLVLLLGEIDLSVGSVAGATAAVLGVLVVDDNWPWWAGILAMLAVGALIGAFQGVWFAILRVPSFVVTLAGFAGLARRPAARARRRRDAERLRRSRYRDRLDFPSRAWGWALAAIAVVGFAGRRLLEDTRRRQAGMTAQSLPGLSVQAVQRSLRCCSAPSPCSTAPMACRRRASCCSRSWPSSIGLLAVRRSAVTSTRSAVMRKRLAVPASTSPASVSSVFALAGTLAALVGPISTARLQAASTQTGGGTLLLESIAAAVIGATSLFGGRGSVWAALLGALVIGSVSNGLDLVGQPADVKYMVEGAILLLAVTHRRLFPPPACGHGPVAARGRRHG